MRGKEFGEVMLRQGVGITPAHAGKSPAQPLHQLPRQDHPRPCGEKSVRGWKVKPEKGSPPPMRGKGPFLGKINRKGGITPAHAGKRAHNW